MPSEKRKFGDLGEKIASNFLKRSKHKIVEINYLKRIGEIDIISKKKNILHFIEVKTRTQQSAEKYGLPEEAIASHKQKKIVKTAQYYLLENKYSDDIQWQIDVIAITINENKTKAKINYIENAINYESF
ncbi:MAG: YraN family protein [Candidatus Pacebacteria bacterium]|nr:YraN family protein [Candidatus Paceibacterota bacterium]